MDPLEYYAAHHCALFPIPYGSKDPWGIINSFAHDWSRDSKQWATWRQSHPNCNFGVVAGPSRLIIVDIDVAEVGQETAWGHWDAWCKSHGLPVYMPQFESARGGWHVAFALRDDIDIKTLRQVPLIGPIEHVSKKAIVDLRVGNGYVVSAGSHYDGTAKGEESGDYKLISAVAPYPVPDALIASCTRAPRATAAATGKADANDTQKALEWMAEKDCFADYKSWCEVGMILRTEFGDDPGFALWQITNNGTTSADVESKKWQSFTPDKEGGVAIGTLRKMITDKKCPHKIGTSAATMFEGLAQITSPSIAPSAQAPKVEGAPPPQNPGAEEQAADESAYPTPAGGFLKTLSTFLSAHVPAHFVVKGILRKRFCYSITAQTGTGKTAVAMRIAAHVATGLALGNHKVKKGQVIYFAGENPEDVRDRWFGLTKEMNLDPETTDVIIFEGACHISKVADRIIAEINAKQMKPALIIVDTSAAYFETEDENDTMQALEHARRMRSLCQLPGEPCVVVLCHPTKNAKDGDLIPRGGGAFLNEVDGNIALYQSADGKTVGAQALGKFRGARFEPLHFSLKTVTDHPKLIDADGDPTPTVVAELISTSQVAEREEKADKDEDKVLEVLCNEPGLGMREMARALGWSHHDRVSNALTALSEAKLVKKIKKKWAATAEGQKYLNMMATHAAAKPVQPLATLTPAVLGDAPFPKPARPGTPPPMPPPPR